MNPLQLDIGGSLGVTVISNMFIDQHLPKASGSFVKVYLCLLRHAQSPGATITLTGIADSLEESEKDILRALNYWEKEGLILIVRDVSQGITGIRLLTPGQLPDFTADLAAASAPVLVPTRTAEQQSGTASDSEASSDKGEVFSDFPDLIPSLTSDPLTAPNLPENFEKPDYSEAQIAQLTENDEVKWMFNVIEVYLERLLKPMDVQLILYLYESLGFSAELILYLYEYCVSRNKKSPSYVEAVALNWAKEGINTVEQAEAAVAAYTNGFQTVNKAFGLNRAPGNIEKQYIQKWFDLFGSDPHIIEEACSRTLLQTGKPDFKYADKILENWKQEGVSRYSDIAACDVRHAQKTAGKPGTSNSPRQSGAANAASSNQHEVQTGTSGKPSNKFNAFPQRRYSGEDFSSMEQRLLQKKNNKETR